jgi:S-formylglutathione hydrolase FrmB
MGGHGALFLAFRHQDVFGAAGSMSGGVDLRPFPNNWDIRDRIGLQREHPDRWESHSVVNLLYLLDKPTFRILIDCGTGDFFYEINRNLHEKMLERNIPHDFIERPGVHNWDYWQNAVKYQILFFHLFFNQS